MVATSGWIHDCWQRLGYADPVGTDAVSIRTGWMVNRPRKRIPLHTPGSVPPQGSLTIKEGIPGHWTVLVDRPRPKLSSWVERSKPVPVVRQRKVA